LKKILVVDDEQSMRDFLSIMLKKEGYAVLAADRGSRVGDILKKEVVDLIISDIRMPDITGIDVLRITKEIAPETMVILITAYASTKTAIQALKMGAYDYIIKPFDVDEVKLIVKNALDKKRLEEENIYLKAELQEKYQFENMVGASAKMLQVFEMIKRVADTNSTVLIHGPSGTGKELVAKAIHFNSQRRNNQFVSISCGAMPEPLLESELFGHMKGAFTGAHSNKKGLFEIADKGTLLLDEIGELSMSMQVKLLRVLQEKQFRRVGGTEEMSVDVRIVAATNRDLQKMVHESTFREDLFYRINVIPIKVPPLKERKEDIRILAQYFLEKYNNEIGGEVKKISEEALTLLEQYDWPGNVRELENVIERAVALEVTDVILPERLSEKIIHGTEDPEAMLPKARIPDVGIDLEAYLDGIKKDYIRQALETTNGVQKKAADLLKMSFRSFRYYVKKFNLR
jgi:two-component system response regulator PilR (NtrC family)